jgi:Cu(I)/Ag(I) efflux system membrane fusion protein
MQRARILAAVALAAFLGVAWWASNSRHATSGERASSAHEAYQCPMHPQVVSTEPERCPICGMTLTPIEAEPAEGSPDPESGPGIGFSLSPDRVQSIGLTTATAEYRELHREIRTAGRIAFDPDLYAALAEYREVIVDRQPMDAPSSATGDRLERHRALAVRLKLLGLSPSQLEQLFAAGAEPQSFVLPGRSAWVYGRIYGPATEIRPGQTVRVTARSLPGRRFLGQIVTVESDGDSTRGTTSVRALVSTPGGGLRAESFVHLVVEIPLGRRLAVPEDAVLDTGTRQVAIVVGTDGRFEPRDVVAGVEAEGQIEILSGISPGDRVVTAANFLIDSESRFRAALASLSGPSPSDDSGASRDSHALDEVRAAPESDLQAGHHGSPSSPADVPHAGASGDAGHAHVEASSPARAPGP